MLLIEVTGEVMKERLMGRKRYNEMRFDQE